MSELISDVPVRKRRRQYRSLRGMTSVHGHAVGYESGLERDFLHLLSIDPTVLEIAWQPLAIRYLNPASGKEQIYTPDFFVRHGGPSPGAYLFEVKYRTDLWKQFWREGLKAKLLAARRLCREQGWTFRIRTEVEIRGPKATNIAFLRGYMHLDPDPGIEEQLAATLAAIGPSTPQALLVATFWHDDNRAMAIPYLWHMVVKGRIECDLALPLTMSSRISITVGEGYQWTDPYSYRSPQAPASARPTGHGASRAT